MGTLKIKEVIKKETIDFNDKIVEFLLANGFKVEHEEWTEVIATRYRHQELPIVINTIHRSDSCFYGDYDITFVETMYCGKQVSFSPLKGGKTFDYEEALELVANKMKQAQELALKIFKFIEKENEQLWN